MTFTIDSQFRTNDFTIIVLNKAYSIPPARIKIDGMIYDTAPVFDANKIIAIKENGDFAGKVVEFIYSDERRSK